MTVYHLKYPNDINVPSIGTAAATTKATTTTFVYYSKDEMSH